MAPQKPIWHHHVIQIADVVWVYMILYVLMVYNTLHRVMLDVLNLHLLETPVLR